MDETPGLALARDVVAHFEERRHQPLLDSERRIVEGARTILAAVRADLQITDISAAGSPMPKGED